MFEKKQNDINYTLMFDGGSRGNPGICGCGFVIYMNDELISQDSCVISENNTNNYAEYMALILGLTKAKELNIKKLFVKGDSKLVINQVTNKFNVKSENLKNLYAEAKMLILHFDSITFEHVKRNLNKVADKLANHAMDLYEIDNTNKNI